LDKLELLGVELGLAELVGLIRLRLWIEAGLEKMTMCISILLALVVFLLLVSKILPPTSITIPLIAKYLLFTFIMNIVTILITVIIINWNFKTPRTRRLHSRLLRQLAATFRLMTRPYYERR